MENAHESYSFEKEYFYSIEVPVFDYYGQLTDEKEVIEGYIKFYADAEWDECEEWYVFSGTCWEDSTNTFSHDGDAPAKEEEFYEDFRKYLLSQGVKESEIESY